LTWWPTPTHHLLGINGKPHGPRFSANGRFLAFYTPRALIAADTNGVADVYLYDFDTGTNLLVSRGFNSSDRPKGS